MLERFSHLFVLATTQLYMYASPARTEAQTISADNVNGVLYVKPQGIYPPTQAGIQAALDEAKNEGGGRVVLPPTKGTPIQMGSGGLTLYSNVCLVGAGMNATVLN